MQISFSKWRTWTRCLRKGYYKYILKLEQKIKSVAPTKGKLIHSCLEAYYLEQDFNAVKVVLRNYQKGLRHLFDEERILYKELPHEVFRLLRAYHYYWKDLERLVIVGDKSGPIVEREYILPLAPDVELIVILDLVVEDELGIWAMDHKSAKSIPDSDFRTTDVQSVLYTYVLQELGLDPMGMMFNYLRTKTPTKPQLLKSGQLSRRKIDTDKITFLSALREYGLDPADYKDILSKLSYSSFFSRVRLTRPQPLIEQMLKEVKVVARTIEHLEDKSQRHFPRTILKACDWDCEYRPLCIAEMMGHDTEFMIKTYYKERRRHSGKKEEARGS